MLGLLYTMANDAAVPVKVRQTMSTWGLCKDEFPATSGFPPALYVRAARRLVGDYVFTQNSPKSPLGAQFSIGLGGYNFDSHNAERLACRNKADCWGRGPSHVADNVPFAWNEGDVQIAPGVYEIPYNVGRRRRR